MTQHTVEIVDMEFVPAELTIEAGDEVRWKNLDNTVHTVSSDAAVAPTGPGNSGDIGPGTDYVSVFPTAQVFKYHCAKHPDMTGTVTVE